MKHAPQRSLSPLLLILAAGVLGFGTACTSTMQLSTSPPGAEIIEGAKTVGTTPMEIQEETLKTEVAGGHLIQIKRAGYQRVWVWIPNGVRGLNLSVNLQPFVASDQNHVIMRHEAGRADSDLMSAKLLDMQAAILAGTRDASGDLDALSKANPDLASVRYLSGLNKLRQGQKDGAKADLTGAVQLAPSEPDYAILLREAGGDPAQASGAAPEAKDGKAAPAASPPDSED